MKKDHLSCPKCGHHGCRTEWDDGGYYCFSCQDKPKGKKLPVETKEVFSSKVKPYRNLTQKAVDKYNILTQLDKDGKEVSRVYPYPHKPKVRILPKDFSKNPGFSNDHLFGMDKFNAGSHDRITIVEGEDDAPAAFQMLGGYEAVVALPGAGVSNGLLRTCHKYLDSFKEIIICTDNDHAGDNAAAKISSIFPGKSYRVPLSIYKDPMEYLENGKQREFSISWKNRKKYVPEFDSSTSDEFLRILHEDSDGDFIPSGIDAYDEEHLGLFQGFVTMFQAPEGTGKTELFHFFENHLIKNYPDIPFASIHLEETKQRTLLSWVSYDLDKNVTRKDLIEDMDEVEESIKKIAANENAHLFSIGTDENPEVLLDRIKYYVNVFQCKYIFIEPIQDLAQQYYGPENTERFLSRIAVQLARIATELKVGIVIIAHENDDGLVSDCRKLSKQAGVVVRLERDVESTDPEVRNTTTLRSRKNRPTSFVGYAGQMRFDPTRFVLEEYYGT